MLEAIELTFYSISHAMQTFKIITEDYLTIIKLPLHSHQKSQATPAHKHITPRQAFQLAGQFGVFASQPIRTHAPKPNTSIPMPRLSILSNQSKVTLYLFHRFTHSSIV